MAITIVSVYLLCVAIILIALFALQVRKKNNIKDEEE